VPARSVALLIAVAIASLLPVARAGGPADAGPLVRPAPLVVRVTPPSPRQGDVAFVLVSGAQEARRIEGSVGGVPLTFFPYGEGWAALAGIDLETRAGKQPWRVGVIDGDGTTRERSGSLTVRARAFPVQRLTLPTAMVDLDPEAERRAGAEAARLRALYGTLTPERLWQGRFTLPLAVDAAGSGFGSRRIINGQPRRPHSGTDWAAERGTPVVASNRGRVVLVGDFFFGGRLVMLDHGLGLYTLYMHLDRVDVAEGSLIGRGEALGAVGSTGRATGPHLHFQVQLKESRVDPAALLELPVRD
jgi:murein DD-endopeptidase MepM/ murein hydrolase activator NlpD